MIGRSTSVTFCPSLLAKRFLTVHYFARKLAQNNIFFFISAGDRVFLLLYNRIYCVTIVILLILLSFIGSIEN